MQEIGKKLNLAPHTVSGKEFPLAADVEGHVGHDGRFAFCEDRFFCTESYCFIYNI